VVSIPFNPGSPMSIRIMSGALFSADLYRFGSAFRLADHLELFAVPENGLNSISHDFVIVDEKDLEGHIC